jgi:hypothetical protein
VREVIRYFLDDIRWLEEEFETTENTEGVYDFLGEEDMF